MLLYIGYRSGTDVLIYWLTEWNWCCYILATRVELMLLYIGWVELMLLYIGYRSETDVVIYWLPEWNWCYIFINRQQNIKYIICWIICYKFQFNCLIQIWDYITGSCPCHIWEISSTLNRNLHISCLQLRCQCLQEMKAMCIQYEQHRP